jgi:hypothetical protein
VCIVACVVRHCLDHLAIGLLPFSEDPEAPPWVTRSERDRRSGAPEAMFLRHLADEEKPLPKKMARSVQGVFYAPGSHKRSTSTH